MNCGWRLSGNTARFPICLLPCRTCFSKAPSNLAVRVNGLIPTCYLVRGNQFIQTCGPANCAGPHFPENLTGPSPRSPRAKLSAGRGRVLPPKGCEDPKGGEALRPVSPQPLRSLDALPQSQPLVLLRGRLIQGVRSLLRQIESGFLDECASKSFPPFRVVLGYFAGS